MCVYGPVSRVPTRPHGMGPQVAPPSLVFASYWQHFCVQFFLLFCFFFVSSFVFAGSLQHFWLPASHLLGTCYLLDNLRSTHTPYPVCAASAAILSLSHKGTPAEIAWPAVEQLGLPRCGEEVATRWPQTCLPFSNGMLFCTRSCNHFISTSYFGSNLSGISLIHPCFVYLWLLPVGFKKTTAW